MSKLLVWVLLWCQFGIGSDAVQDECQVRRNRKRLRSETLQRQRNAPVLSVRIPTSVDAVRGTTHPDTPYPYECSVSRLCKLPASEASDAEVADDLINSLIFMVVAELFEAQE